jgi:hypothetical protein
MLLRIRNEISTCSLTLYEVRRDINILNDIMKKITSQLNVVHHIFYEFSIFQHYKNESQCTYYFFSSIVLLVNYALFRVQMPTDFMILLLHI